jgi:hypothetical protein
MGHRTTAELLDAYMDQQKIHSLEGRRGMEHLCQIAGALGYKDPQRFGQLSRKAAVGDLLCMLEDNSGLIEAMIEWIRSRNFSEFREPLEALVAEAEPQAEDYETYAEWEEAHDAWKEKRNDDGTLAPL